MHALTIITAEMADSVFGTPIQRFGQDGFNTFLKCMVFPIQLAVLVSFGGHFGPERCIAGCVVTESKFLVDHLEHVTSRNTPPKQWKYI